MKKKATKAKGVVNKSECMQALVINDLQSQIEQLKNEVKMLREAASPGNQKKTVEPIVVKQLPLKDFKFTAKNLIAHAIKTLIFNQFDDTAHYSHETKSIDTYQKVLGEVKSKYPYFVLEVVEYGDDQYSVQVVACIERPSRGSDCATSTKETDWEYGDWGYDEIGPELILPSNLIDFDECANTIVELDEDCVFVEADVIEETNNPLETNNSSNEDNKNYISANDVGVNIIHSPVSYAKLVYDPGMYFADNVRLKKQLIVELYPIKQYPDFDINNQCKVKINIPELNYVYPPLPWSSELAEGYYPEFNDAVISRLIPNILAKQFMQYPDALAYKEYFSIEEKNV